MDKFKEFISNLNKTPKGKAVLFFAGYFLFFIFLMVFARVSMAGSEVKQFTKKNEKFDFSVSLIEKNNYSFNYEINIDDTVTTYTGDRYLDNDLFITKNDTGSYNYYRLGKEYFNNNTGVWLKSEDPYLYADFYDIKVIKDLITKATLIYNTDYESGRKVYNFNISTTTIYDYFEGIDLDLADDANEIIVSTFDDGNVEKFEFKLDSYCKNTSICNDKMRISLLYSNYGEVKEITSPLDQ